VAQPPAKTPPSPSSPGKPSAEDEVFIREIDEAVRQDDTAQFLKKYGLAILALVTVGLLGMGGYLFWDAQKEAALEAESDALVSALDYAQANDFATAGERADPLLDSETPGIRTAARFLKANAALEQGDVTRAVELFAQIADDEGAPQALRDLARVREVSSNFDEREPAEVIERLKDLAVPGHALFGSAAELTAIAHLEAGDRQSAGALFAAMAKDEELPETLSARARQMAGLLGVDAIEDVEQLLEEEAAGVPRAGVGGNGAVGAAGAPGR